MPYSRYSEVFQSFAMELGALRGGRLEIMWDLFGIPDRIKLRVKRRSHMR